MRSRPSLPLTAVLALFPPQAPPQQHSAPNAPPMADDDVSCLITGEFDGDTHADAVVLTSTKLALRSEVEARETYVWTSLLATDIANLRGTGAGGRDRVVAVGATGLNLLEFQDSGTPWQSKNERGSGTYWASALAVRTGQVDGQNGDDIVAVTSNRVLVARSDEAGWMSDFTFLAGSPLTGVELVDWDGKAGGALEIAVLIGENATGGARIRLFRWDGLHLETIQSSADRILACPIATAANGPRWLAAIATDDATGNQDLCLASDDAFSPIYSFTGQQFYEAVALDFEGNGVDDLILGNRISRDFGLFRLIQSGMQLQVHSLDAPPEAPIPWAIGHPGRDTAVQDGGMDVADVDHDGDLDLVVAVQGTYMSTTWQYLDARFSEVRVSLNPHIGQDDWVPWPAGEWPAGLPLPTLDEGVLSVPLVTPAEVLVGGMELEYELWRTPDIDELSHPAPLLVGSDLVFGQDGTPELPYTLLELDIDQYDPFYPDRYTLILRQVVRDGQGAIVDQSPALKATFFSSTYANEFGVGWTVQSSTELSITERPDDPGGGTLSYGGVPASPPNPNP
ncbi:MAG TPA: hypothetical protein VF530_11635 [Planctomycetota bacterium]